MAIQNATKLVFETSLRELLKSFPIQKITIQNICDHAHTTRTTFYHHFRDKYDLVAWIYERQATAIMNKFPEISWFQVIVELFECMDEDVAFYSKVLADREQNSLLNYMVAFDISAYKNMLTEHAHFETIGAQLEFDINFHAYACVHMTELWNLKPRTQRESPEEMATLLLHAMPSLLFSSIPSRGI